jgi:hypothetical protein
MHGLPVDAKLEPGRQLICGFISRTAPPSVGSSALAAARSTTPYDAPPAFLSELSPTARAMMAAPSDEPQPQPTRSSRAMARQSGLRSLPASTACRRRIQVYTAPGCQARKAFGRRKSS